MTILSGWMYLVQPLIERVGECTWYSLLLKGWVNVPGTASYWKGGWMYLVQPLIEKPVPIKLALNNWQFWQILEEFKKSWNFILMIFQLGKRFSFYSWTERIIPLSELFRNILRMVSVVIWHPVWLL